MMLSKVISTQLIRMDTQSLSLQPLIYWESLLLQGLKTFAINDYFRLISVRHLNLLDIKFYLTAEAIERAKRRQAELWAKGSNQSLEQIQSDLQERDKSDQTRAVGPLKPADDAIVVDTTDLSIEQVLAKLLGYVKKNA